MIEEELIYLYFLSKYVNLIYLRNKIIKRVTFYSI